MRYHGIMLVALCLAVEVAMGQSVAGTPSAGDPHGNWTLQPAPSSAVHYRAGPPATPTASAESPFRFRSSHPYSVVDHPAPRPMDRDAVLGTDRPWVGGRPPVECALTPHDPQC